MATAILVSEFLTRYAAGRTRSAEIWRFSGLFAPALQDVSFHGQEEEESLEKSLKSLERFVGGAYES
jgi:hypothetical protein